MTESTTGQLSRRNFIRNVSGAGVALWLGLSTKAGTGLLHDDVIALTTGAETAKNFTPYILVESNGAITLFNTKPEMGQGTFQSIPALIAEEFEVSLDQVTIKLTNGEKVFGPGQSAGGSTSIRTSYEALRKVGASAKEVFIQAAAAKWNVETITCYAENGKVFHQPTKQSFTYGELVEEASKLPLSKEPKLKDPKDFKILSKLASRPDVPMKTNGTAEFGLDIKVPDMLYATIERCPVIGGTLKSFDATEAFKIAGVVKVLEVERVYGRYKYTGVAVLANSYWAATQARQKLNIQWDTKGYETFNSTDYEKHLRALAKENGLLAKGKGSVDDLNLQPANIVEAFYETPMVAHHTMETMNCIAQVNGDKVEIWTSTQVPSTITGTGPTDLPKTIGFAPENVTLHNAFVGGGFGRRLTIDYITEAINLAKQVPEPVKLIWTREDTTRCGPYRSMTFSQMKAGFSDDGKLVMYQHKVIGPTQRESLNPAYDPSKVDGALSEGIGDQSYEIPNVKTSVVRADFHVPLAAWRSVISATTAFAHECFIDELAYKAKKEPFDFRLSLLSKPSDVQKVMLKLKTFSNWDKPLPKGKFRGVAVWDFFAGLCGQVIEVTYANKKIRVDRVYAVIDLGEVVNPDNVKNQVEGGIVMAFTAATKPCITIKNGQVEQHNFYDNQVLRINEMPDIEVMILADGGKIKGVGEPSVPPFAPALANAIFAATGKRLRKMPFDLDNIG